MSRFLDYLKAAQKDRVPQMAVLAKCRKWGIPRDRAEDLSDEGAIVAYGRAFEKETKSPDYFNSDGHFRGWVTQSAFWYLSEVFREEEDWEPLPTGQFDPPAAAEPGPELEPEETPFRRCFSLLSEVKQKIILELGRKRTLDSIAESLQAEFPDAMNGKNSPKETDRPRSPNAIRLHVFRMVDKTRQELEDCLNAHGSSPYRRPRSPSIA